MIRRHWRLFVALAIVNALLLGTIGTSAALASTSSSPRVQVREAGFLDFFERVLDGVRDFGKDLLGLADQGSTRPKYEPCYRWETVKIRVGNRWVYKKVRVERGCSPDRAPTSREDRERIAASLAANTPTPAPTANVVNTPTAVPTATPTTAGNSLIATGSVVDDVPASSGLPVTETATATSHSETAEATSGDALPVVTPVTEVPSQTPPETVLEDILIEDVPLDVPIEEAPEDPVLETIPGESAEEFPAEAPVAEIPADVPAGTAVPEAP